MTKRKLGLSIYPEHSMEDIDKQYLVAGEQNGFTRIFMSMLEAKDVRSTREKFKRIIEFGNRHGMSTTLDIAPHIFNRLGTSYRDLSFFKQLGADTVRLDQGFDGLTEAEISYNSEGLSIELNMSNDTGYLANILSYKANKPFLQGCHNFYPQLGTGLDDSFFERCSQRFKNNGLDTAAFISSASGQYGPWPVNDGLPTRESDRKRSIVAQAKLLFASNLIDDVIIGNAYASESELAALGGLDRYQPVLSVELEKDISDIEEKIVLEESHMCRGDLGPMVIRSTASRVKYRDAANPAHDNNDLLKIGDIVICNDSFGNYKNELQIILRPHKDSRKNKVGRVKASDTDLIAYISAWSKFKFER